MRRNGNGGRDEFIPGYHAAEVVPPRKHNLPDVDQEEHDEAYCEPEVEPASDFVASDERCDPVQAGRFPDGETGEAAPCAHKHDKGISDTLGGVVSVVRRGGFTQMKIVKKNVPGITEGMAARQDISPRAAERQIRNVSYSVYGEEPHEEEVIAETRREIERGVECAVEPVWKESEESMRADADAVDPLPVAKIRDGICPINEDAAPDHGEEKREIDPVHPADRKRMFAFDLDRGLGMRCHEGLSL